MDLVNLTAKLIIGFAFLFITVKIVGKKMMNQITPFTFISSIVFGELLGNGLYDHKVKISSIIYSICLWGFLLLTVEFIGQKFLRFRRFVEGKPSALIKNGMIDREALRKSRMNINQLQSLLRQSETFSIREVAFCYLESNGSISILKKAKYQKTKQKDFQLPDQAVHVPVTIIKDGQVFWDEIHDLGFDNTWLTQQLEIQGVSEYKDVFFAEWLEGDGLFLQRIN
ncbi:DUF421 domain-containing protein [Bacillus sp. BRMEA1]|uniref:DUF421 domain-containing protein n=1 Tax=Neobacillus endophyticus TaxID=2738405 RepID=UPI001564898A|nr:DUF421 domain-containing protein [Neobacillus endophyticus]NRD79700.1 DUF421 domain-containing protein [Neobacillus endophyticus]